MTALPRKWRRRWHRTSLVIRWSMLPLLLAAGLLFWHLLPPPQTVFAVSARTETVEVQVSNPQAAAFGLRKALLLRADGTRSCLSDVRIAPDLGATMQYVRFGIDPVTITIDRAATRLIPRQGIATPDWAGLVQPPVQLRLDPADHDCPAPKLVRLPLFSMVSAIGDDAVFGDDPLSPRLVLLSGAVRMLVRAIDWHLAAWYPPQADAPDAGQAGENELFAVDEMVLPPGSVIHRAQNLDGKPADWWGFVDVMFGEADERGLQVEASSHARSVAVTLPAVVSSNGGAEDQRSLLVDFVQRWSSDPSLRLVALLWAAAGLIFAVFGPAWQFLRTWSEKTAK